MANIIELLLKGSSKGAVSNLKQLKNATKATKTEIGLLIANVTELTKFINKATDASDKYNTSMRLLKTVLKDTNQDALAYVNTLSKMTGINEKTLTNHIAKFAQVGKSLNMTEKYAERFAEDLTDLTAKLAILYDYDFSVMASNVQKAIQGTQTTLRDTTGIEATAMNEQAVLMENGINRQVNSLNEGELAIVRYAAIVRQVTGDMDVYQKAVNSLAWQKQMLKSQVERLSIAIGQVLTPVLVKVYTAFNAVIIVITEIIKVIGKFFNITVDVSKTTASATTNMSSGYKDLANDINASAKAVNKSLRSFDKLNNITTPKETGAIKNNNLGIDSGILGLLDSTNSKMLDIENNAQKIADTILSWLGFTRNENGELEWSGKLLASNIIDTIKKNWKWFLGVPLAIGLIVFALKKLKGLKILSGVGAFTGIIKTLIKTLGALVIIGGLILLFKEFSEFLKTIQESGLSVKEVLALIGGVLLELVVATGLLVAILRTMDIKTIAAAVVVLGGVALILSQITTLVNALSESGMSIKDVLIGIGGILAELIIFMGAIVGLAMILSSNPLALVGVAAIALSIMGILKILAETLPIILDALGKFIVQIAPPVITLIRTIGDIINEIINNLGRVLPPIIDSLGGLFNTVFSGIETVVRTVGQAITGVLEGIRGIIQQIGDTVSQILRSIDDLIRGVSDTILDFVYNIGPAIEHSVDAIISSVTKIINFVISGIEYMVNRAIDGINGLANVLNSLPFINIKNKKYISIPRFKGYKEGGFPDEEDGLFYANHNEMVGKFTNGKTAVANNDQIVKGIQSGVFNGMMSALRNSDFGGSNVTIEASGDTEGLLNFISFKQKQVQRQFT